MELDKIEKLLEKYFDATTTVAEEEILREYFSNENIPAHLEQYAPMFQYFSFAKEERFTKQLPLKTRNTFYKWASVAAVAVFMIGFYFYDPSPEPVSLADQYTEEEIASAQEALALLAMNFNKGTEQLYHLEEFERNTNKFLTKE
ncbi:hypothetical protein [Maribacter cobaltidurans]|uniref:Uncharacterized protein n=1 Tax=Maribacter cobaltidurans TaxID=1178778 RepID=A0A223V9U3_9FLAO|nr:hypothetical protein [Maribacter cobaltidurans]ASV31910.1 hypothetical protein CJ263_17735 [Maribacter cobaltidurans]GGD85594.1 hypothetical protein GCM10011412_24230 [Maribacter cobaltidurans]